MFLHNINYDNFDIQLGDTLLNPKHMDEQPFETIVSTLFIQSNGRGKATRF